MSHHINLWAPFPHLLLLISSWVQLELSVCTWASYKSTKPSTAISWRIPSSSCISLVFCSSCAGNPSCCYLMWTSLFMLRGQHFIGLLLNHWVLGCFHSLLTWCSQSFKQCEATFHFSVNWVMSKQCQKESLALLSLSIQRFLDKKGRNTAKDTKNVCLHI